MPGKHIANADFLLTFLTTESPIIGVIGGVADSGGNFTHEDGMDGEEWTERGAGVPRGTGVKYAVELG